MHVIDKSVVYQVCMTDMTDMPNNLYYDTYV